MPQGSSLILLDFGGGRHGCGLSRSGQLAEPLLAIIHHLVQDRLVGPEPGQDEPMVNGGGTIQR